jgi:ubiquinone/menaquinone biosynthesis C-methylase UbiE
MASGTWSELRYWVRQGLRVSRFLSQTILGNLYLGRRPDPETVKTLPPVAEVLADLKKLFERDWENVRAGVYRIPSDKLENPLEFARSSYRVFRDLVQVKRRQADHLVQELPPEVAREQFPRYFTQTFHYQTGGYLTESSADLYDHQVEMVFAGGADAMRRLTFPWIRDHLQERGAGGVVDLLDVPCGTGRYLRFLKENLPELRVTGVDLSPTYLKKARENLASYTRADFVEANVESLPFKDATFDVLTSIYLFHELPARARAAAAKEMARVLRPGGLLVFEDSIQLGDKPSFDGSLKHFPVNYHEPYYADYVAKPVAPLFEAQGLKLEATDLAFFSKILVFRKGP